VSDHLATATELALAVGFRDYRTANHLYGILGGKIEKGLGRILSPTYYGIGSIVVIAGRSPKKHLLLKMRDELACALEQLGWVTGENDSSGSARGAVTGSLTEVKALRDARVGQGKFRAGVVDYWRECAVTGCKAVRLLAASHIKPWQKADDAERLDANNGLLLTPNLHVLFDVGHVSFADDGKILISKGANSEALSALGIQAVYRIRRLTAQHREYLRFHRANVFAH
jgi:hypothetical protein